MAERRDRSLKEDSERFHSVAGLGERIKKARQNEQAIRYILTLPGDSGIIPRSDRSVEIMKRLGQYEGKIRCTRFLC